MPLPNTGMDFTAFDALTATQMDDLVENIEALADGSGLNADSVPASAINFGGAGVGVWWEEIGRTTLGSASDTISVASLPARKYIKVMFFCTASGGAVAVNMRLNNDSGTNYSRRNSTNGGADATAGSQTSFALTESVDSPHFGEANLINVAAQEKMVSSHGLAQTTAGGASAPGRYEAHGKWANASDAISRIDLVNTGAGDFATGSEAIILGHD